jgi:pimeloyl-ACP methyl ester carboxylesterase
MLKILKYIAISMVALVLAVVVAGLLYRAYVRHRASQARAIHSPNGINSLERVRIGGIDQWIEVRGQDVNNPILLFIHGGPGVSFMPLAGSFTGPWEEHFTVVEWDQRGAGKTYGSNDPGAVLPTMKVAQMEQDALEVVEYTRQRFQRERIFVVGHSWGSVLGLWLAHEHPEMLYAYVGTGQVINERENEELAYQDALLEARRRQDKKAIQELEGLAPYPPNQVDLGKLGVAKGWEEQLLRPTGGAVFLDTQRLLTDLVAAPEYSLRDDVNWMRGQQFSEALVPELMQLDLAKLGTDYRVPVFFFEGRHDPYCRASLVEAYSRTMQGERGEVVWFDNSGHFPFFEERDKFLQELLHKALPMAKVGPLAEMTGERGSFPRAHTQVSAKERREPEAPSLAPSM